jgi:uncharacterized membrane protein
MTSVVGAERIVPIHPFHAAMLAASAAVFLFALLADWTYWNSYEIQWSNFASWLLIGAMMLASIALVFALVDVFRGRGGGLGTLVLAAAWLVGFFDALHHARDAWAIMPTALVLSALATVLACVAAWIGFATLRVGGVR